MKEMPQRVETNLVTYDTDLLQRVKMLKKEESYGEFLEYVATMVDELQSDGIRREELIQLPVFHALIGSSLPSESGTVHVERTLTEERQHAIERVIKEKLELRFGVPSLDV